MPKIVNIGFDSFIITDKILAVLPIENSIVKRLKQHGMETGKTVNLTFGKRTRSVLITESGHIMFSFLPPEKLIEKLFSEKHNDNIDREV
ncbi:MAG: extracellular matrix/biofilm biosynthesis regulator RemA family protein [Petrotogales bacterium]